MFRAAVLLLTVSTAAAGDWPQFRGPTGDGHYTGPKLPTAWGPDTNVAWKAPIPGKGWSSPVVSKGKVYLSTAVERSGGLSLRAICVDAKTGEVDWDVEALSTDRVPHAHQKNSHASPTPVTDGELVYVHFGHLGTAALDLKGKVVWKIGGKYKQPVHGNGGSPLLVGGKLVFSVDALDKQAVFALNTRDGSVAWEAPRKNQSGDPFSFSTPTVTDHDGKKLLLSAGSSVLTALDAETGRELWRFRFNGYSVIPRPVVGHGLVYFSSGYDNPVLHAVRLGGTGDVTKTHEAWNLKRGAPNTPSPLLVGNELYLVSDKGLMTCLDAKSGAVLWEERLKGSYSASPFFADGKIYLTSEEGKGTLVEAGRKSNVLGEFDLGEKTFASFAAADGAVFVRTESQLYKFVHR